MGTPPVDGSLSMNRNGSMLEAFNPPRDAEPNSFDEAQQPEDSEAEVPTVLTKLQKWVSAVYFLNFWFSIVRTIL